MALADSKSMKASTCGGVAAADNVTALQRRRMPSAVMGTARTSPARSAGSTAHVCITLIPSRAFTISRMASVSITKDTFAGSTPAGRRMCWIVKLSSGEPE